MSFNAVDTNADFCSDNEFSYDVWSDLERELALFYRIVDSASALFPSRQTVVLSPQGEWILVYQDPGIPNGLDGHAQVVAEDVAAIQAANNR